MIHRHLDYRQDTPIDRIPVAALADLLDRGDLGDWQPIATAVAHDPWGPLAERVARLVDAYPMYGTSSLWRAFIDRCRARAEGGRRRGEAVGLAELRRRRGLTQVGMAQRLSISQSDVSKLERRRDLLLSTLKAYTEALGGELHHLAIFPDEESELDVGR